MMRCLRKLRLVFLSLFTLVALTGCDLRLFDPKGVVGLEIRDTIYLCVGLMLLVVIPTIILSVVMPIKYRSSKTNEKYEPEWEHSNKLEAVLWGIPVVIIIILAIITYIATHKLDPREPIESDKEPLTIQVVALDWKWLFIYPEENVASINEIAIPVNQPVEFLLTSNSSINSFFIPRLGGQLYAMAGMENRLNLMGTEVGTYRGISSNYSGYGFSKMKFKTKVMPQSEYNQWLTEVRASGEKLDSAKFEKLEEPTRAHPVEHFSSVQPLLFKDIIEKFTGATNGS